MWDQLRLIFYGLTLLMLLCTFLTLGYKEVSNIIFLSVLYPLVLWVLNHVQVEIILQEKLIAVMLFGVIYGVGAGITYRLGYSYGGTDTLAKILKKKVFRAVELKNIMLALEGPSWWSCCPPSAWTWWPTPSWGSSSTSTP